MLTGSLLPARCEAEALRGRMVPFRKVLEIIFISLACMACFRHQSEKLILLLELELGHFKLWNLSYNWFCQNFYIRINSINGEFTTLTPGWKKLDTKGHSWYDPFVWDIQDGEMRGGIRLVSSSQGTQEGKGDTDQWWRCFHGRWWWQRMTQ